MSIMSSQFMNIAVFYLLYLFLSDKYPGNADLAGELVKCTSVHSTSVPFPLLF